MIRKIVLISYYAPSRGHAGGLRLLDIYGELRKLRPDLYLALITFAHPKEEWDVERLESIFDETHCLSIDHLGRNFVDHVNLKNHGFDLVDLQYHQCGALIDGCRKKWPTAIIAFSPMESMLRSACLSIRRIDKPSLGSWREFAVKLWLAFQEICYVKAADRVILVSSPDRDTLAKFKTKDDVFCVETGLSSIEYPEGHIDPSLLHKESVVFFAFFESTTNRDSLIWYCRKVHPRLRDQVPGYILRVVGRGVDHELIETCACEGIEFVGEVRSVQEGLSGSAVGIAPALGGAGVRGKIHQYAAMGIPCVASPLACEGLEYQDGDSILVAADPVAFADACAALLKDVVLHDRIGSRSRQVCLDRYTWKSMEKQILSAYALRSGAQLTS